MGTIVGSELHLKVISDGSVLHGLVELEELTNPNTIAKAKHILLVSMANIYLKSSHHHTPPCELALDQSRRRHNKRSQGVINKVSQGGDRGDNGYDADSRKEDYIGSNRHCWSLVI